MEANGDSVVSEHSALGVRVTGLESDLRELKGGLGSLSNEMRRGFSEVATQLADRQKTPWAVIFGGAAVLITVLSFIGQQAISPLQAEVSFLKMNLVSRAEHEYRERALDNRLSEVQRQINFNESQIAQLTKEKLSDQEFRVQHIDLIRQMEILQGRIQRIEDQWFWSSRGMPPGMMLPRTQVPPAP